MPPNHDQTLIRKLLTTVNYQGRQICELKQRLEQHREREKSQSEALAESAKAFNDIERWRSLLSEKQQDLGQHRELEKSQLEALGPLSTAENFCSDSRVSFLSRSVLSTSDR